MGQKEKCHQKQRKTTRKSRRANSRPNDARCKAVAVENADYLSLIGKTKSKVKRNQLIEYASREQINAIAECIDNVLRGIVPLSGKEINYLRRYKTPMRLVSNKRVPLKEKKSTLKQRGGFLTALLPIAASVLGPLLGRLFGG